MASPRNPPRNATAPSPRRPCPPRRRRAALSPGSPRPTLGGANLGHLSRRHERGGPRQRLRRRRRGRRQAALEQFWRRVSEAALFSPFRRTSLDIMLGRWTLDTSPMFLTLDLMARIFSPYDLNPHGPILCATSSPTASTSGTSPRRRSSCSYRNQCAHRARAFPQRRADAGGPARLRLPADDVSGHRDRRRGLLGWRIFGQSHHYPADPGVRLERYDPGAGQSRRTTRHAQRRDIVNRVNEVSFNATLLKELRMMAVLRQVPTQARARAPAGPACASIASRAPP